MSAAHAGTAAEPAPRRRFGRRSAPAATAPARRPARSTLRPLGPHYVIAPPEVGDDELSAAMGSLRPVPNALVVVAAAADAAPVLREQMAELGLIARTRGASSLILAASGLAALGPGGRRPAELVADKAGLAVVAPDGLVSIQPDGTFKLTAPEGCHEPATWWNCPPGGRPRRLRETVEAATTVEVAQARPEAGLWPAPVGPAWTVTGAGAWPPPTVPVPAPSPPAVPVPAPSRTVAATGPTALPASVSVHRLASGFWLSHVTARPEGPMPFLQQLATPPGTTPLLVGTPAQPVLAPDEFADAALSLPIGSDQLVVSAPWADPGSLAVMSGTLAERLGRPVHASIGLPVAGEGAYTSRVLDHRGATTWEPYLLRLTSAGRHDTVSSAWRNGGAAWQTVGPGVFRAFPFWCLEAVPAGLWLRPEPPYAWAPRFLRPDPAHPLLVVGEQARLIPHDVWEQLAALLDQLPAPGVRGFGLLLHGLVDSASESSARFFARMHDLVWLNAPAHPNAGQQAGPPTALPASYAVGGGWAGVVGAPAVPERFALPSRAGEARVPGPAVATAPVPVGPVAPGPAIPTGPVLPMATDPGLPAPTAPPAGLATSSEPPATTASVPAAPEPATATATATATGRPGERPPAAPEPALVTGPVRPAEPVPEPNLLPDPAPDPAPYPEPTPPTPGEPTGPAPELPPPPPQPKPVEPAQPASPAPVSPALAARYFGAPDVLPLAPVSSAADRDAFRTLLGDHYQRCAGRVEPAVTRLPGLRSTGRDDFKADLIAVLLHHEDSGAPAGRAALIAEARSGAPGPLGPYLACLASGLRRLPSHHGAVLLGADLPPEALEAYAPGLALVEPAPVAGLSSPAAELGTPVEFVVWSTTGRRTAAFGADGEVPQVAFPPGTGLVVVEVVAGDGAARPARVLLREATGPSAAGSEAERDRSARDRLRAWLERRDKVAPADRRAVVRPERFRFTPGAVLPEPRPEPRPEAGPEAGPEPAPAPPSVDADVGSDPPAEV